MTYNSKSSADLEREVNEQRDRVEARIGAIKDKLSPGQLLDEALSYTKHGGAHFASSLGGQISANPLPATLVGIGLAWLISSTSTAENRSTDRVGVAADQSYPYARTSGGLRRVSHKANEAGQWWSEFENSTGQRYKAKSTAQGDRAGHFTDEAGKMFGGFIDDAGNRISDFQDEAGNVLSHAWGWADHSWRDFRHSVGAGLSSAGSAAKDAAGNVMSGTRHLGSAVQQQSDQLSRQVVKLFDQQPLIAGALAFAVGAAVAASLPHTEQEDQLLGEQADKLRGQAADTASKLYEDGKEKAAALYEDAAGQAGKLYHEVKDKVTDLSNGGDTAPSVARH